MRRIRQLCVGLGVLRQRDLGLFQVDILLVERPGKIIAVVQEEGPVEHLNRRPHLQVPGLVQLRLRGQHARHMHEVELLGELRAAEEARVRVTPGIAGVALVDLHCVVTQEVVHSEKSPCAVPGLVIPVRIEPQHVSVVLDELLESIILTGPSELQLRVLFHVHDFLWNSPVGQLLVESLCHGEIVRWRRLLAAHVQPCLAKIELGKIVRTVDAEPPGVDLHILPAPEVLRGVVPVGTWHNSPVPLQERTLRHAAIFDLGLLDGDSPVLQVVVQLKESVELVLNGSLHSRLLQVDVETKNLTVVFEPRGLHRGTVGVAGRLLGRSTLIVRGERVPLASQQAERGIGSHLLQQVPIHLHGLLLQVVRSTVQLVHQGLAPVVPGLRQIMAHEPGQEGQIRPQSHGCDHCGGGGVPLRSRNRQATVFPVADATKLLEPAQWDG
mmetsp:Transcript_1341/g.2932  ORF Transcript_1341/g.2932 Transcript_1341/m.2932 type:complete len:440 (+) Transcript_1341:890-2209(+)